MSFEITIRERREVRKLVGKEWVVLGTKEVERDNRFVDDDESKTRIEEVRGYSPEIEKVVTEDREVLKQTVDKLDMVAVIKAINGLKP